MIEYSLNQEAIVARPLSDKKREAILAAAAKVVASEGVGGSIAKIAKAAGVAEGTIFTYFDDKEALLNELYLSIKADLAGVMTTGLPSRKPLKARCQHVWERYIDWGHTHAPLRKAMGQLAVSERISPTTKEIGTAAFSDVAGLLDELAATGALRGQSLEFVGAVMESIAETTLTFIAREPARVDDYRRSGFEAFWGAVSKE